MDEEHGNTSPSTVNSSSTCCGCISVRRALSIFTVVVSIMGSLATVVIAIYIAQNINSMTWDETTASSTSLGTFAAIMLLSILGLVAAWRERIGIVEVYFWLLLVHWILDLAATTALLVVVHQKWQPMAESKCANITPRQACMNPYRLNVVILTCYLCVYKVVAAWSCYFAFRYQKELISKEKKNYPILRWLRRTSTSSISSIWKEKKWWSPSQIPVIKIDFASDQSSASSYSNESPGYRTVAFGQVGFNLVAPPQPAYMGDGVAPLHEIPTLSYSGEGSQRRPPA